MASYSTTDLLPPYPTPPFRCIDDIIITLWIEYLDLELQSPYDEIVTLQRMRVIDHLVEFWEIKQHEIYRYELQKR